MITVVRIASISCLVCWTSLSIGAPPELVSEKKLLHWGWDETTPKYVRHHIREMETMPFDGITFSVPVEKPGDEWLSKSIFRNQLIPPEMIEDDLSAIQQTRFDRFTDNFTSVRLTPCDVDWFDDFSNIFKNVELVARFAKRAGLKGLILDCEMYSHATYLTYTYQKYVNTQSYEQYLEQVEQRGAQVMRIINSVYSDITIILTHGYQASLQELKEEGPLKHNEHGLRHAFINGMVQAASDETTLVEGYESSYGFRTEQQFYRGYHQAMNKARAFCPHNRKFAQVWRVAFALMLDYRGGGKSWNSGDWTENYRSPDQLERDVALALQAADKYAWLYNERPKFFPPQDLPDQYVDAIRRGKARGNDVVDLSQRVQRTIPGISEFSAADLDEMFSSLWSVHEDLGTLEGPWWFRVDPQVRGFRDGWHQTGQSLRDWQMVKIPSYWEANGYPDHDGVGWYRTKVHIDSWQRGRKLSLAFGGVDEAAKVFVNGQLATSYSSKTYRNRTAVGFIVGSRKGENQPFQVDISRLVQFGADNVIVVEVFDTRHVGGISRPVKLIATKQ